MNVKERYTSGLSPEDLSKAVRELQEPEDNDERLARIDQLRDSFVNSNLGLDLIRDDDVFILRFLRARKFDHERALQMLVNYHKQKVSWPEVFDKVKNPSSIQQIFDGGCVVALDGRAVDDSAVCVARPGKVENMLLTEFLAAITLTMEQLLKEEKNQIYGITVIEDLEYFGMDFVKQMGPSVAKRFIGWLQDAMPVRIKGLNFVNQPKIFDVIFAIVRPFMKEKMKKRLQVHGNTFASLHKAIDSGVLPPAYGGTGQEIDGNLSDKWKQMIFGQDTSV